MIIVEVMTQMILLQPQSDTPFHREMMDRKMNSVVADIAEDESGRHCRAKAAERCEKET